MKLMPQSFKKKKKKFNTKCCLQVHLITVITHCFPNNSQQTVFGKNFLEIPLAIKTAH